MKTCKQLLRSTVLLLSTIIANTAWADMSGTWSLNVETSAGNGNPTFVLTEDNGTLSGTYEGTLGQQTVTGKVEGNTFSLTFTGSTQGIELKVTYQGTVDGDSIKGDVDLGGQGTGTFTGTRKP